MNCACKAARPLAYLMISAGCLLAVAAAFRPNFTAGWYLSGNFLICGLLPYVVYGSLTEILTDCALLLGGSLLLFADCIARLGFDITAAASTNPLAPAGLSILLIVLVLPLALLFAAGIDRLLH